jgi:two-component sensor histidine kinase
MRVPWASSISVVTSKRNGIGIWALSLAFFAASFTVRLALSPWLDQTPFLTFYPALMLSALVGGLLQGLLVLLLSATAAWYFFLGPTDSFDLTSSSAAALLGFLMVGGFDILLVAALAEVVRRLAAAKRVQESLLRELQHRVANNIQIMTAMLQNSKKRLADSAAATVIDHAAARVGAMAKLHRRLCDRAAYADGIVPLLQDVLADGFHGLAVETEIDIRTRDLSMGQMTALVLLVNEAAMNAAKHAFSRGAGTTFAVSLVERPNRRLHLVIADDGPGFEAAKPCAAGPQKLGMTIMQALAGQLGGELTVQTDHGTTLSVEFAAQ